MNGETRQNWNESRPQWRESPISSSRPVRTDRPAEPQHGLSAQLGRSEAMQPESRNRIRDILRSGPALLVLLIGAVVAISSLGLFGQGSLMAAAIGWFAAWLIMWSSLPMFGRAFHLPF